MKLIKQLVSLAVAAVLVACSNSETDGAAQPAPGPQAGRDTAAQPEMAGQPVEIMPGLSMRRLREGTGETAKPDQIAVVHYTGWLYDETAENNRGDKFDSSVDRGKHFEFPLGAGRVIRGWDEGVVGMKVGEVRELTIAPELAYGDRQVGDIIPAGSTLVFEVELADLRTPEDPAAAP